MDQQRLQDIYNQLESVYAPQRAALQQQQPLLEQQAAAQRASLEQARQNAFRDITTTAGSRGMLFSGFTPAEQATYTGTKYLPALAGVEQTLQQRKMGLEQQLTQLQSQQRQSAQDLLSKQLAAEETARQRDIDRQLKVQLARMSAASRGTGRTPSYSTQQKMRLEQGFQAMAQDILQNKDLQYKSTQGAGYLSPESFRAYREKWVSAGFNAADFNKQFQGFANPTHLWQYGLK
jgi:hypothetical protein